MTSPVWDPHQYARHSGHRNRPITDLLARVPALPDDEAPRIADLGCGPGGPSVMLADRWPGAHITGYDNSPAMLHEARAYAGRTSAGGSLEFTHADLSTWRPARGERFDLIFSNAALQWVLPSAGKSWVLPHEVQGRVLPDGGDAARPGGAQAHPNGAGPGPLPPAPEDGAAAGTGFFPTWISALPPGGVFAFQVPGNFDAPSHTLLLELRNSPRWRGRLGSEARGGSVRGPAEYLAELEPLGCDVDAWETTYAQLLNGEDPVLDWVKGTALRPVLTLLADDPEAQQAFLAEYGQLLREAYPPLGGDPSRGTVFPFRRIFVVAVKR
ncbi:methyltransferase domain-containing protein [Streptomyces bathyalis]|uniref:Methyltransferase domain-containing protein n=1 Tax=Streptomyces bathyalis TaxID=2710756 RepID=A0A7T1T8R6_9ACTN|nr:methyltransferase domain-containing protein [Streptomyces bathyalis]QPP08449.1 methyltransferase domain-containing protein [Streptomyces bathyalis]